MQEAVTDATDRALLRALQGEGRATNAELAGRVGLSESACSRRVRRLEESGLISGYAALIDPGALGLGLTVFLRITLASQSQPALAAFEEAASSIPEVMECYLMTGEADYLVRVLVRDTAAYEALHAERLTRLPGVARISSSVALRTAVRRRGPTP